MNGLCDQFLPCSGFSIDQHVRIRQRDLIDIVFNLFHPRICRDNIIQDILRVIAPIQDMLRMLFNLSNVIFAIKETGEFDCANNLVSIIKRICTSNFFEADISLCCQFPFKIFGSDPIPRGQQQWIILFQIRK